MDWEEYKKRCDQPHVWSRWMLEQCIELFVLTDAPHLAQRLQEALRGQPLSTPDDFSGGDALRMFELKLSQAECDLAVAAIKAAVRNNLATAATEARGLGGFVEAWQEYAAASNEIDVDSA